jgi:hypothetical protein
MAANLYAAGSGQAGQQVQGVVAQYQLDGINGTSELSATSINPSGGPSGVTPYDSGTILGTVPPGKAGLKLVDGTVQRASQLLADGTAGVVGNALVSTFSSLNTDPTPSPGSQPADGLSQAPNRE